MGVNACAVLMLFALAIRVNSTPADREGGAGEVSCTLEVPEGKTFWSVLIEKSIYCVMEFFGRVIDREFADAKTISDYQQAVKRGCDNMPNLSQCVEGVRSDVGVCLDSINKTMMTLQLNYTNFTFELFCSGQARIATIAMETRKSSSGVPNELDSQCKLAAYQKHVEVQGPYQDPNTRMKREYHVFKDAISCMEKHRGEGHDLLVDNIVSLWSETLDGMKCVDPQHGTEILCKTIIEN